MGITIWMEGGPKEDETICLVQYIGRSNRHGRKEERTRCWRRGGLLCVCTGLAKVPWMVSIERGEGGFYRIGLGWVL